MKTQLFRILCLALVVLAQACSQDEPKKEGDPEVNHVGERWKISSLEYNVIDQSLSNPSQTVKNGTAANAGFFYFDGAKGSFDIEFSTIHKEDVFSFQQTNTDVNITSISQSVSGAAFSQNVITLSGEKGTTTTMTLEGTITKQSMTGQFVLTGTFQLVKE